MSWGLSILTTEYVQGGSYSEQLNHKNLITTAFNAEFFFYIYIWTFKNQKGIAFFSPEMILTGVMVSNRETRKSHGIFIGATV